MKREQIPFEKQIFVCINNRNKEKPSCADHDGEAVFQELRKMAKDRGLHPRIRVAQAKCLGKCSTGTNIMVYPDNIWYSHVQMDDVQKIADIYMPKTTQ